MDYLKMLKDACFAHDSRRVERYAQLDQSSDISILDDSTTPMEEILRGCHQRQGNQNNAIKLLKLLMDLNYDINEPNSKGATPLHYACKYGLQEVVRFLLDCDANATILDDNGFSAFIKTIKSMLVEKDYRLHYALILYSILDQGSRLNKDYEKYFHLCRLICEGDVDAMECHLKNCHKVDFPDLKYDSPLYIAMQLGNIKIVKMLVDKGKANVNIFNNRPLLHDAIVNGNNEIVSFLLHRDIDIEALALIKGKNITPLMAACTFNRSEELLTLLEFGADVKKCDKEGFTALHVACAEDSKECVKILAAIMHDSQINLDMANVDGITPLHLACSNGSIKAVQELVKYYKDLKTVDKFKYNVLHYAAMNENSPDPLKFLLKSNFSLDLESSNDEGESPLKLALRNLLCKNVKVLLNFGAEIKLPSKDDIYEMENTNHELKNCQECPIAEMCLKLNLLGHRIDRRLMKILPICPKEKISEYKIHKYQLELEDLKKTTINCHPAVSLFDILLMSRKRTSIYANNTFLKSLYLEYEQDFRKRFQHYGFLLNLKYKSGTKRHNLMNTALLTFNRLLGTNFVKMCGEAIFDIFSNPELEKFIEVETELKSAI